MASNNEVAIVTGSARPWGLGRSTALGLAQKGLDIVICDIRDDWGQETVETIQKETGQKVLFVKTDVTKKHEVETMVKRADEEFGRIDVLVNVAAIVRNERIEQITEETMDAIYAVNFKGTVFTCQAVVPVMRRAMSGRIVNVSSGGAWQALKGLATYAASKAGVTIFTKTLAWEVARYGIVAMNVAPGRMATRMGADEGPAPDEWQQEAPRFPFLRGLHPDEVAEVIIFAATSKSPAMAGQVFHANAGAYMI